MIRPNNRISWTCALVTCLLLASSNSFARVTAKALPELVKMSSTIVFGEVVEAQNGSQSRVDWAAFRVEKVVRGTASPGDIVQICRTPPPMTDYPDVSRWLGHTIIVFLSPRPEGCMQLSHSYVSVVEIRDDRARTAQIDKEPDDQPCATFMKKLRKLSSKKSK